MAKSNATKTKSRAEETGRDYLKGTISFELSWNKRMGWSAVLLDPDGRAIGEKRGYGAEPTKALASLVSAIPEELTEATFRAAEARIHGAARGR